MNILETLVQLRDDIKTWVTNNLKALETQVEQKTIPIDSELSSTSQNPVQNKVISKELNSLNTLVGTMPVSTQIANAIAQQPHFSGDYNDLKNAPNISEDNSGELNITDESGNIILKADTEGIHSTNLSLSSDSLSIGGDKFQIADKDGNVALQVDGSGTNAFNLFKRGEEVATEKYVDEAIGGIKIPEIPEIEPPDLTGYATETYVVEQINALKNGAPILLDTLGELAAALGDDENFAATVTKSLSEKAKISDLQDLKAELSESIESTADELVIADEEGRIITRVDENGLETTEVTAGKVVVNNLDVEEELKKVGTSITNIKNGDVVVSKAAYAESAGNATNATNAENANHATSADSATNATNATNAQNAVNAQSAESAEKDGSGNIISSTYETKTDASEKLTTAKSYADGLVEGLASQEYVDQAVEEVDLTDSISKDEDGTFTITDSKGNIILIVDETGLHTINMIKNLVDGSTVGSLRSVGSTEEEGEYTMGQYAFAEGYNTKAKGNYSHAEGNLSIAAGAYSHAEGSASGATGAYSHAENSSEARGKYTHSEGRDTIAIGKCSHTEGEYTVAHGDHSHVQGKFNTEDTESIYAHIVGNGTDDENRSNAHTLDWKGNAWYAGNVYVGGASQADASPLTSVQFITWEEND